MKTMDVVFATNNSFCPHAAVAICSLLENNKWTQITVHLFVLNCYSGSIQKLSDMVKQQGGKIIIYDINESLFERFPPTGCYSLACYLRLCTPSLLKGIDKVLYLDCDLVVNGCVQELWNMDLDGYSMAALEDATLSYDIVKDYIGYDYFKEGYMNSGVLLMNLKYWREHHVQERLFAYLNTHMVKLPDQDALNVVLHGTIKSIHPKWNCHVGYFAFPPLVVPKQKKYIKELWKGAKIIHFTGPAKPWYRECVNPYKYLYRKYRLMTPWKNEPLKSLEDTLWKTWKIVFLRKCKNFVAHLMSYSYR